MRVLGKKVLIKPIKKEKTTSGLILPESSSDNTKAEVILVGEKASIIKQGDIVKHHMNRGVSYDYLGDACLFINEDDIIAIL